MNIEQVDATAINKTMREMGSEFVRAYRTSDGLRIIHSIDHTPHGKLKHVSVSRPDVHPSWEEIKQVKQYFFGDKIDAMMVFPRSELWVNVHEHTFHLWQIPTIPGPTGRWELM